MEDRLQIVIPAAGLGQRFSDAGYIEPKPLIPVGGIPMLKRVINNIMPTKKFCTVQIITRIPLGFANEILLDKPTQGAVQTILKAKIDSGPLLIANCDQLLLFNPDEFVDTDADVVLATFWSQAEHHSYVELTEGVVTRIAEKQVISPLAVSGVYYFRDGDLFKKYANKVIDDDLRVNGEFYLSSVLAEMIRDGILIRHFMAPTIILGTPNELRQAEVLWQS